MDIGRDPGGWFRAERGPRAKKGPEIGQLAGSPACRQVSWAEHSLEAKIAQMPAAVRSGPTLPAHGWPSSKLLCGGRFCPRREEWKPPRQRSPRPVGPNRSPPASAQLAKGEQDTPAAGTPRPAKGGRRDGAVPIIRIPWGSRSVSAAWS